MFLYICHPGCGESVVEDVWYMLQLWAQFTVLIIFTIYLAAIPEQECLNTETWVNTSIHTDNTKVHISKNTCNTSLQHTGLFNITQYTDLFKRVMSWQYIWWLELLWTFCGCHELRWSLYQLVSPLTSHFAQAMHGWSVSICMCVGCVVLFEGWQHCMSQGAIAVAFVVVISQLHGMDSAYTIIQVFTILPAVNFQKLFHGDHTRLMTS